MLQQEGIEGHVVDPASIATSRRRRRAKTDRIDGETLLRALLAYKRGEPRVCAMVKAPTVEEEDRRRLCRERKALIEERVLHVAGGKVLVAVAISALRSVTALFPPGFCERAMRRECVCKGTVSGALETARSTC